MSDKLTGLEVLPADVEALLTAERIVPAAPAGTRQAVYQGVLRQAELWQTAPSEYVADPQLPALPPALSSPLRPVVARRLAAVGMATFSLGIVVGALGSRWLDQRPPAPHRAPAEVGVADGAPVQVSKPSPAATKAPGRSATETKEPAAPKPRLRGLASARRWRSRPTLAARGSLAAERELLDVARAAVARRNGKDAQAAIDRHAQAYPHGGLVQERESLRIQTLALAGRVGEARQLLERFDKRYPGSLLRGAARRAVEQAERHGR